MRLLASTDFALRTLMLLAGEPSGRPFSVDKLSRLLGNLSRNHLHKIVQNLAAMGLVRTIRGSGGGVVLAVAPESIKIGTLIRELEGDQPVVECFRTDGGNCTLNAGCRLRGYIRDARNGFYRDLDQRTIADCLPRHLTGKVMRRRRAHTARKVAE
ncbi:MAG: Rrf2 family transcriptional regulator [Alphaproteobacteria bacterium]|nr:Rrf2 family transcriptional regulator [Alphaproteobacteria bacterium]MDE2111958.1 Rrf2 family transcriptional regulator [Alphaproteobacteria bacterium]MDE2493007.1 Rrf2 family transcriptional regulator [Alphaproteobacteria bacterium]